jgi:hypothetical protein
VNTHRHAAPHEHEHEFEAEHGLPEPLPADERLLWQGAPDWRRLAIDALHVRTLAIYFALMVAWRGGSVLADGGGIAQAAMAALFVLPLAALAVGLLAGIGWLMGRTTVYTITDRRVVMRVGIVLTITFNLPYRMVASAALRTRRDGTGDITLALVPGEDRIAYLHLWPHVRPWKVKHTQPMLRALPDAEHVARLLSGALAASAGQAREAVNAPRAPRADAMPGHGDRTAAGQGQVLAA